MLPPELPRIAVIALALMTFPTAWLLAQPDAPWGTDFGEGYSLHEAGWENFLGAREAMPPRVAFQGRTQAGEPPLQAVEFSLDVAATSDWFGGLFLSIPPMTEEVDPAALRLRATLSQRHAGPLMIRLESSPENWIGVRIVIPEKEEWVKVDTSLKDGERSGDLDLTSDRLRLVIAFINEGQYDNTEELPSLLVKEVWLDVIP